MVDLLRINSHDESGEVSTVHNHELVETEAQIDRIEDSRMFHHFGIYVRGILRMGGLGMAAIRLQSFSRRPCRSSHKELSMGLARTSTLIGAGQKMYKKLARLGSRRIF